MSKTTENIIVVILMVAIVAGMLYFVGYSKIEDWLSTPFVWKEPEYLSVEYLGAQEQGNDKYIYFQVHNSSEHTFDSYKFRVETPDGTIKFGSLDSWTDIEPYSYTTLSLKCSTYSMLGEEEYNLFKNMSSSDIENLEYRVVELSQLSDTIFENKGWGKVVIILVVSLVLGLFGLVDSFPVWLRIILKVCSLPLALFVILLLIFGKYRGSSGAPDGDSTSQGSSDSQFQSAQQRYNRAANQKAGALNTGNTHSAAKAQEEMDRAMADMIAARGGNSDAAARYRREANLKAGATITGNAANAARAQANMDKAMADMIKNK